MGTAAWEKLRNMGRLYGLVPVNKETAVAAGRPKKLNGNKHDKNIFNKSRKRS
jgi:hypothetical protein